MTLIPSVILWVLLWLDLLPRYERTALSDLMLYFLPIPVAVAYLIFALYRRIPSFEVPSQSYCMSLDGV
jgi:hypothetical protein